MIPIRDDAPRSTTPYVTYFLLATNIVVFLFELLLAPQSLNQFLFQFGMVPASLSNLFNGGPWQPAIVPLFTSMFLHGGWLHLTANMWVLWIFGDNIEDHLGHFRYLMLYLICGVAAGLLQSALNPGSQIPSVGASGAIAGVMGAYFLLFPAARVLTVIPPFWFFWLPAWIVLGYWFIVQFVQGAATSIAPTNDSGGIAFWAHVGGFIAGVTLIKLFPARQQAFFYKR
jgi:membrane associated rhomboid family serine protease